MLSQWLNKDTTIAIRHYDLKNLPYLRCCVSWIGGTWRLAFLQCFLIDVTWFLCHQAFSVSIFMPNRLLFSISGIYKSVFRFLLLRKRFKTCFALPRYLIFQQLQTKEHLAFPVTGSKLKHGIKLTWPSAFELKGRSFFERCFYWLPSVSLNLKFFLSFLSRKEKYRVLGCVF